MSAPLARARAVFFAALDQPASERRAYVRRACEGDAALEARVLAMLAADELAPTASPGAAPGPVRLADDRIGPYRIVRRIADGGMGTVFEAEQPRPRRRVAIKVLAHALTGSGSRERFLREIDILARMRHPNVVEIHDAGTHETETGAHVWFVMELVEGGVAITEHAAARGLDVASRLRLFLDVCRAVGHGHQRGIIHRDLKPANVLVGRDGTPKVIDFGVARLLDEDAEGAGGRTVEGSFLGTLRYMSPEQCAGRAHEVDARADVYALGAILYEMLAGTPPYAFDVASPIAIARTILTTAPRPLADAAPDVHRDLDAIVRTAMAKERDDRYQTVRELQLDIERHLAGRPVEARAGNRWYVLRRTLARHRRLLAAGAAALLLLGAFVVALGLANLRARRALDRADRTLERLEYRAYLSRIERADRAIVDGDIAVFDDVMQACPPRFRGWEWALLRSRAQERGSIRTIRCAGQSQLRDDAVLVSTEDGRLVAIDVDTGTEELLWSFDEPLPLSRIVAGPGTLVARTARHHAGALVDRATGSVRMALPPGPVPLFAPDGRRMIVHERGSTAIEIHDLAGADDPRRVELDRSFRHWCAGPGGRRVAIGTDDGAIVLVDVVEGGIVATWPAHAPLAAGPLAFTHDGAALVSAGDDGAIRRWDLATQEVQETFDVIPEHVRDLAVSPDDRWVLAAGSGGRLWLFDAATGSLARRIGGHAGGTVRVHWLADGRRFVSQGAAALHVHMRPLDPVAWRAPGAHASWVDRLAVTPDGRRLVSAGQDRVVTIRSTADGAETARIEGHRGRIMAVAVDPTSARAVSAGLDGLAQLIDLDAGRAIDAIEAPSGGFRAAAWRDADAAVLATDGGHLVIWSPGAGSPRVIEAPGPLHAVAVAADGTIAAGGAGTTVRIRAPGTLAVRRTLEVSAPPITALAFVDADTLAVGSGAGLVTFLEVHGGRMISTLHAHERGPKQLVPSPDGRRVISVAWNERARLLDPATGRVILDLLPDSRAADPFALAPDWSVLYKAGPVHSIEAWPMAEHAW